MSEWDAQLERLGAFVRTQRQLANLSLRQLAQLAQISNPYLSQLERGMHEPSVRVLRSLADALGVPTEVLLARVGLIDEPAVDPGPGDGDPERPPAGEPGATEAAIRADRRLTADQKQAVLAVYRSFVGDT